MIPAFVIGLREGLEAALIIGIIAAFLRQRNPQAVRAVWVGVLLALAICTALAVGLQVAAAELPQKPQELLETVIGLLAVGIVTYMLLWMRKNARNIKGNLEAQTAAALADGSARALVGMAFLAVLREGVETAIFLLSAVQASSTPVASGIGAVIGVICASIIGWLLYKGGTRINLQRFFRITGAVLAVVAAGLFANVFHTAHEAGIVSFLQTPGPDLTAIVQPGSVQSALITGMLGIQAQPVALEMIAWAVYLIPALLLILWPARRRVAPRAPSTAAGAI